MEYAEVAPRPELRPYVKCLWTLRGDGSAGRVERVVPDGCCEIVLNRADPFRGIDSGSLQPHAMLVGQIPRFIRIQPTGAVDLLGVRFLPGGLFPFLRVPQSELTEQRIDLADACAPLRRELEGADRDAVERALLGRLDARRARVGPFVERIVGTRGRVRVGDLGIGARTLERRFRREVGLSPKRLARILRFQAVIHAVEATATFDWAGLALDAGYCDQAHLIRDFRDLAGMPPGRYFAEEHPMADFFSGVSGLSNP